MSRTLLEQIAIDRANLFSSTSGVAQSMTITTGEESQSIYGIFHNPQRDANDGSGYKTKMVGDFFVMFNSSDVTVALDEDSTVITIGSTDYKVRKVDPHHANRTTVYLK